MSDINEIGARGDAEAQRAGIGDTPETDAVIAADRGDSGFIRDLCELARKLERERDEARGNLEAWRFHSAAWGTDPDEVRKYIKRVEAERDEANEKLRALSAPAVSGVLARMASPQDDAMNAMRQNLKVVDRISKERDELRAEVVRLKADKARLDWLDNNAAHIILTNNKRILLNSSLIARPAIDAAMKGEPR